MIALPEATGAVTPELPSPQLFDLQGQNVLITGGNRGIGFAIAIALAEAGAAICFVQRDIADTSAADVVRAKGGEAHIVHCNLIDMEQVKTVFDKALPIMGGEIHILVNCAGVITREPSLSLTEKEWDRVTDTNIKSLFLLCQSAGKHMIPLRRGKIINVSSIMDTIGGEGIIAYSASKGGVRQLTKALSNEWSRYNVQINAIAPGFTETDINADIRQNSTIKAERVARAPARRWGLPKDFAGPAVFLASKASQFVCGTTLYVDGGVLGS